MWLAFTIPTSIDSLLVAIKYLILYTEKAMTQLIVILSLQEDRVESKAFCCMLHALQITNYISALGMRLNWYDNRYEVERWFLTRDSWTCTLAMTGNGALFIPSTLRVWVPFRLVEVYWNAGTEMFFVLSGSEFLIVKDQVHVKY